MKVIHIYDINGEKVDSIYATSLEDFRKEPTKFFPAFLDRHIVSEIEFAHPVAEEGKIREATKEELLKKGVEVPLAEGEVVVKGKLKTVNKPETGLTNCWKWNGKEYVYDISEARQKYFNRIDEIKAKVLAYGFNWNGHRQRCRDKDISAITSALVIMQAMGGKDKIKWYFEDNHGEELSMQQLIQIAMLGKAFMQSVYDAENYFKIETEPQEITEEMFEEKRASYVK